MNEVPNTISSATEITEKCDRDRAIGIIRGAFNYRIDPSSNIAGYIPEREGVFYRTEVNRGNIGTIVKIYIIDSETGLTQVAIRFHIRISDDYVVGQSGKIKQFPEYQQSSEGEVMEVRDTVSGKMKGA